MRYTQEDHQNYLIWCFFMVSVEPPYTSFELSSIWRTTFKSMLLILSGLDYPRERSGDRISQLRIRSPISLMQFNSGERQSGYRSSLWLDIALVVIFLLATMRNIVKEWRNWFCCRLRGQERFLKKLSLLRGQNYLRFIGLLRVLYLNGGWDLLR
jgi:hypothetical protein